MADPVVSIIIPTYNRAALLREAVDSALAQTFNDWEMFIVDDGSTDETRPYLRSLRDTRIQVIEHERIARPARLRNLALAKARGRYIAFLDSDDLWEPTKLEIQLACLRDNRNARWSYTFVRWIDAKHAAQRMAADTARKPREGWIFEYLLDRTAWIALPSVIAERSLLDEARGFDESLRFTEDYELWLRLSRMSEVCLVTTPLATVRIHPGNTWRVAHVAAMESWIGIYDRLAEDPSLGRLRPACLRARARAAAYLAGAYRSEARYRDGVRALLRVLPTGALLPAWWLALAKTAMRPLTPGPLLRAYHRGQGLGTWEG